MSEIGDKVKRCYIDHLDDDTWLDDDPAMIYGSDAIEYFAAQLRRDASSKHRARLVRIIWQFRDIISLPVLEYALRDTDPDVWKEAIDGIVAIGGNEAAKLLEACRTDRQIASDTSKAQWINEAILQIRSEISVRNSIGE